MPRAGAYTPLCSGIPDEYGIFRSTWPPPFRTLSAFMVRRHLSIQFSLCVPPRTAAVKQQDKKSPLILLKIKKELGKSSFVTYTFSRAENTMPPRTFRGGMVYFRTLLMGSGRTFFPSPPREKVTEGGMRGSDAYPLQQSILAPSQRERGRSGCRMEG